MPVHQINVNPPDWQPPLSLGPNNNTSPAGSETLPEWTPRVRPAPLVDNEGEAPILHSPTRRAKVLGVLSSCTIELMR